MPDSLTAAKGALKSAEAKFPSSMAKGAGVTPASQRSKPAVAAPKPASAPVMGDMTPSNRGTMRQQNIQAAADTARQVGMNTVGTIGVMHKGGTVPETGKYLLEKGEEVIPADKNHGSAPAPAGRQSEYRKVYAARRAKRGEGGNAPVSGSGERPEAKKAEKQANAPKAGAHVKSE